jgi:hypothetical protein
MAEPLDTMPPHPPPEPTEVEMALFGLNRARAQFAWKVGGLDAAALHRRFPPSEMTLARLIKHLAWVEDWRTAAFLTGSPVGAPWDTMSAVPDDDWSCADGDSPSYLYELWQAAVARSRAAWAALLDKGGLDQVSTFRTPVNLRWVIVDMHEEYARHTGHADLFREAIDGLVGEDPPA